MSPVASQASKPRTTRRQLKALIVLLLISNILTGVVCVYLLRVTDRRYSDLIDHSVPVLNDLQTLTADAVRAMASTNPARAQITSPAGVAAATRAVAADAKLRAKLHADVWLIDDQERRREMETFGAAFTQTSQSVIATFARGDSESAIKLRDLKLRVAFDHYIQAITAAADAVKAESARANDLQSAWNDRVSKVMLGVASWPLLLLGFLAILTVLLVLVLSVLFRHDEPV